MCCDEVIEDELDCRELELLDAAFEELDEEIGVEVTLLELDGTLLELREVLYTTVSTLLELTGTLLELDELIADERDELLVALEDELITDERDELLVALELAPKVASMLEDGIFWLELLLIALELLSSEEDELDTALDEKSTLEELTLDESALEDNELDRYDDDEEEDETSAWAVLEGTSDPDTVTVPTIGP